MLHLQLFTQRLSMRKLILISAFATLFMVACKPKSQKLIGKWSVSDCSITNLDDLRKSQLVGVPDSLLEQYKGKLEGEITGFIEDAKKDVYTFGKDSFEVSRHGKSDKGTWKISSDMKMLFLIPNENPAVESLNIVSLSGKEIKLSRKVTTESSAVYILKKQ